MDILKGKKLAVFGDSIMFGSGNGDVGVGEYLQQDLGFELHKFCVGGARTGFYDGKSWIVEQVQQAVLEGLQPDYIVFDGFTNDCCKTDGVNYDVPLGDMSDKTEGFDIFNVSKEADFTTCFEEVVCGIKKYFKNAKILFVRPHNMGRRGEEIQKIYGERAVEICKKWGVAVADIYQNSDLNTFLPDHRDLFTADTYNWGRGDSTHPNARGYTEKYMPIIEEQIKKL